MSFKIWPAGATLNDVFAREMLFNTVKSLTAVLLILAMPP